MEEGERRVLEADRDFEGEAGGSGYEIRVKGIEGDGEGVQ